MAHLMRIEAEAATLDPPMTSFPDVQAFGGQYIASNTGGVGTARWSFNVSVPGDYVVWCRVKAPSTDRNSWYVKADSGSEDTFDAAEGNWSPNWQWSRVNGRAGTGVPLTVNPRKFNFSAGAHTLRFREREASSRVDRVIITNDFSFVPTEGDSSTFTDVPPSNPFYDYIENVARNEITGGCGPDIYCPAAAIKRSQMAVMILKAKHGSNYVPPAATGHVFSDVPRTSFAAAWIERLAAEGITSGCGNGKYCPNSSVTRAQMAVFLLKAEHGESYVPPAATGMFSDVPASSPFRPWIERLAVEGITSGCGPTTFCPNKANTRGQMATFLVRTFDLP